MSIRILCLGWDSIFSDIIVEQFPCFAVSPLDLGLLELLLFLLLLFLLLLVVIVIVGSGGVGGVGGVAFLVHVVSCCLLVPLLVDRRL